MKFSAQQLEQINTSGFKLTEEQTNLMLAGAVQNYIELEHNNTHLVICANKLETKTPKDWLQLLPLGKFGSRDGRGPFDIRDVPKVLSSIERNGMPIAGDYEHKTYDWLQPNSLASGWITELRAGEGFIEGFVTHTAKAKEMISSMEMIYLSPVFSRSEEPVDGFYDVEMIVGYGLTNNPALYLPSVLVEAFSQNQKRNSITLLGADMTTQKENNYLEAYQAALEDCNNVTADLASARAQLAVYEQAAQQAEFETRLTALGSTVTPKVKDSLMAAFTAKQHDVLAGMFTVLESLPKIAAKEPSKPVTKMAQTFDEPDEVESDDSSDLMDMFRAVSAAEMSEVATKMFKGDK